jgi:Tol biopolymer transport system component
VRDVYLRDRSTGTTLLVSQSSAGAIGGFLSTNPDVSSAGPFVAFESPAFNLVPMDGNASTDVFVRDVANGLTILVSVDSAGTQGNRNSFNPAISDDGRYVAFDSSSSNLVLLDGNNQQDVFVRDLLAMSTFRVSVSSSGAEGNNLSGSAAISADGQVVAFTSRSTNFVEFDTNQKQDVFIHVIGTGVTARVSVATDGTAPNQDCFFPSLSADGRFVAFQSAANNLVPGDTNAQSDVFVYDRGLGVLERASVSTAGAQGTGASSSAAISADGRYLVFQSTAPNLVSGDTNASSDVFLRDRFVGTTLRLSVDGACANADGASSGPAISGDGAFVAFQSLATNLVESDVNTVGDVFVHDSTVLTVDGIYPDVGSETGGETARIPGFGFPDAASISVAFGGVPATVTSANPFEVRVRVPAGTGTVDVSLSTPTGCATVPRRFTYVDPATAARLGNVNLAFGDRENVVLVNGRAGNLRREVLLGAADPFRLEVLSPSNRATAKFVLYVWAGIPDATNVSPQPGGIGTLAFPTPMTAGMPSPQPRKIWNSIGSESILGSPSFPSPVAPAVLLARPAGALPIPLAATFQGIIQDNGSLIRQRYSVTNAVILRVE